MKKLKTLAVLVVCGLAYLVPADNLDRFVPADTDFMAKIRPRLLLDLSVAKDEDGGIKEWREMIDKVNLTGGTLPAQAIVITTAKFKDVPAVIMPVINTPVEMKEKLDKMVKDFPALTYTDLPNKDYSGYRLLIADGEKKTVLDIYYLEKDIIALLSENSIPVTELKAGEKPAPILDFFKGFGDLEMLRLKGNITINSDGMASDFNSLEVKLARSTDKAVAFVLNAVLGFGEPESAMQIAAMGQFFLSMGLLNLTNDAQFAERVGKEIKLKADGSKVLIDASVTEALLKILKEKFEDQIPTPALGNGPAVKKAEEITIEVNN